MNDITIIIPYYNQPGMLSAQIHAFLYLASFAPIKIIVVDDCSKESPAIDILGDYSNYRHLSLYRIDSDIEWNRNGARNLGAHLAVTEWILQTDIDHILMPAPAQELVKTKLDKDKWYRFPRYRNGKADETRQKDQLDPNCEYGKIKPHIDSYLMTREQYLSSPYDERYAGFLGGGSPFLARQKRLYGDAELLPDEIYLEVYTRDVCSDSSTLGLSRDTTQYKELRRQIDSTGDDTPQKFLNFEWHKVF